MPFSKEISRMIRERNSEIFKKRTIEGRTFASIAAEYELTPERIRQIVEEVMRIRALSKR